MATVSVSAMVSVSIRDTELPNRLVTTTVLPSGVAATCVGVVPTSTVSSSRRVFASKIATSAVKSLVT